MIIYLYHVTRKLQATELSNTVLKNARAAVPVCLSRREREAFSLSTDASSVLVWAAELAAIHHLTKQPTLTER